LAKCTNFFFWQKLGIFNDLKIQSILIKNSITSARGNCKNPKPYFWEVFFFTKNEKNKSGPAHPFWVGPTRLASAQPRGLGWCSSPPAKRLVIVLSTVTRQKNENNEVVIELPNYFHFCCRTWVTFCMKKWRQERTYKQKAAGEAGYLKWRDTIVAVSGGWRKRWQWRRFSLLLSCLLCFSSQPSPLFFCYLLFFVIVSGGWRWQCQRRLGGVLWRWRGSTVVAAVVLLLWYIFFFLCHSPFSPLPPPNVPPLSVIFLSGCSLLPLLFFSSSSSALPCFPFFLPLVSSVSVRFCSLLSLSKTYCFSLSVSPFSLKKTVGLSLPVSLPFSLFSSPFVTALLSFSKILPPLSLVSSPLLFIGKQRERVLTALFHHGAGGKQGYLTPAGQGGRLSTGHGFY